MFSLAKNLGAKGDFYQKFKLSIWRKTKMFLRLKTGRKFMNFLKLPPRKISHRRTTKETDISVELNLDGTRQIDISTGISFFNHMLEQLSKHGNLDLKIAVSGDLHIDEHHTIEDVAITLGEAFNAALTDKRGMERYGFCAADGRLSGADGD